MVLIRIVDAEEASGRGQCEHFNLEELNSEIEEWWLRPVAGSPWSPSKVRLPRRRERPPLRLSYSHSHGVGDAHETQDSSCQLITNFENVVTEVLLMQMLSDPCLIGIREALTESFHLGVTVRQPLSTTRALFCSLSPASSGSGALLCRG
jgi:hypothetical protein